MAVKTVISGQWPVASGEKRLSPAMEEWRRKLAAGYMIRPRLRVGRRGYVEWGPALHNPDGAFVQNMRRDTLRKLMRLGLLEGGGGAGMDEVNEPSADDAALAAQAGDGGWVGGDSE